MNLNETLKSNQFPENVIAALTSSGIKSLYPPQEEAIKKGVLDGKNILMAVPTAAGKTLIAELAMIAAIVKKNGRCLYIAPLKALASEKYNDFKNKFEPLGIKVGIAIGDLDSPSRYLNQYNIIVATAEKVDSLLRSKAKWLIDELAVVILDEIHFINDASRGPTLEILIARIKQLNPKVQLVGLSATIRNADELASWLGANLIFSTWRPIPLKEGIYINEEIHFDEYARKKIVEEAPDEVSKLTLDCLRGKGQVLIFVNSRRSAQAVSRQVSPFVEKILTSDEKLKLHELSKQVLGSKSDSTKICQKLAEVVKSGAAFHHAGLKPKQRELIEQNFKNNLIKVIGCTPTLAAGVNLPARRAIIRDCKRFEDGIGAAYIPTSEYKQCAGRAGRPQYDEYGEAVLIAKTHSEANTLYERFIKAKPEPIFSKLSDESALRIHILSSIAGGYVHDVNSMFEFISHTFLYHQKQEPNLLSVIANIFDFLHKEQFIEKSGLRFFATPLGSLTSRLYIDPMTTIILRDGLKLISEKNSTSTIGLLHLICCTSDSPSLNLSKKDSEQLETFASHFQDDFILKPENFSALDDFYTYLSAIKTTWLLNQWIEEEKEDVLCDQFNVGPGDIYRHIESAQWLLYATSKIAELMRHKSLTFQIESVRTRIRHGIKEELLELVSLRGVGRIRARNMFKKGIQNLNNLNFVSVEELANIPTIGKSLALDIKAQLLAHAPKKESPLVEIAQENLVAETTEWEE